MISRNVTSLVLILAAPLAACSDNDTSNPDTSSSSSEQPTGGGSGGAGGSSASSSSSSANSGSSSANSGSSSANSGSSSASGGSGSLCSAARDQALGPIDTASVGDVKVLSTSGSAQTLYIDASAGGFMEQKKNPWVYLSLKTGAKVAVSDVASFTSTEWDLAIKRPLLRTNSGDGGLGQGGAAFLDGKAFADVTAADAASAGLKPEVWFDAECNLNMDPTGAIVTTFDGWYDYDASTNGLTPHPGTFIVRGGDGGLYKVGILNYYTNPDGTTGLASARYKIEIGPLQ
jgi:hypothetical protein